MDSNPIRVFANKANLVVLRLGLSSSPPSSPSPPAIPTSYSKVSSSVNSGRRERKSIYISSGKE